MPLWHFSLTNYPILAVDFYFCWSVGTGATIGLQFPAFAFIPPAISPFCITEFGEIAVGDIGSVGARPSCIFSIIHTICINIDITIYLSYNPKK
jgi:hypothetical protein